MGNHSDGSPNHSGTVATAGQNEVEKFQDPGLPPHRLRLADTDPKAAKRAERQVAVLFGISVVGTLIFLVAYFAIDLGEGSGDCHDPPPERAAGPWYSLCHAGHRHRHCALGQGPDAGP